MSIKEHIPYVKVENGVRQIAQHLTCLIHKTEDLSSIPRTYVKMEGENKAHKVVP